MPSYGAVEKWEADKATRNLAERLLRNMGKAMRVAEKHAKGLVSTGNKRGTNPSAPGTPPHLGTGTLRRSIAGRASYDEAAKEVVGALGVLQGNADAYARRLELGYLGRDAAGRFVDQAPRPFLRPTLHQRARDLAGIIVRGGA